MVQQAGKPVTGKAFVGRKAELALLENYLELGQSVAIIAPRRFGKTSLVLEALRQTKDKKTYTAYIDIFANPTLEQLATSITREVLRNHSLHRNFQAARKNIRALFQQVELKAVLEDFQFILGFADPQRDPWELVSDSIDFVDAFAAKHSKKIMCAYDEFGDVQKFGAKHELVKLFRSKIQQHENSTYLFSGSYESVMNEMFVNSKAPFHRLTRILQLGYMEETDFMDYLRMQFMEMKIPNAESMPKTVMDITRGHPYYGQLALQQVMVMNALGEKTPGRKELIRRLLFVEQGYLTKVWEEISGNREFVHTLMALAEHPDHLYSRLRKKNINVARAVKQLEGKGILLKSPLAGLVIADPLFQEWIKENLL
ncbi:MAG: ATP-binding protein [Bacteroidales bacterium]